MTRAGLNRIFFILPLIFSALACAMVIGSLYCWRATAAR